jgi:hypothetical protein
MHLHGDFVQCHPFRLETPAAPSHDRLPELKAGGLEGDEHLLICSRPGRHNRVTARNMTPAFHYPDDAIVVASHADIFAQWRFQGKQDRDHFRSNNTHR